MESMMTAQVVGLRFVRRFRREGTAFCLSVLIMIATLPMATTVRAAPQVTGEDVCMETLFQGKLNCTANDVAISGVATDPTTGDYLLTIRDDGCH